MPDGRPNILFFVVDQLTAFAVKSYGGTVCKTPNLDALAERGIVFENAYCNYPLCAPSRFSFLSGRLPSRIGAFDNGAEFPASIPTFAHYLRLMGYYACLSGKMHFVGPDQFHGFEERLTTEIYPADFSWTPTAGYRDPSGAEERPQKSGVSTTDTVLDAGPMARTMQVDYDEDVVHCAVRELYVRARSPDARPFLLTVSLTHPHDPYAITRDYWDLYTDEEIDAPRVAPVPLDRRDPHSHSHYFHYGQDKTDITETAYRRARRGYYGMVSYVDDLFGRVLDALAQTGFADDTVVVFTSDHGDMIGERGMWFKKTLFEPAVRVPFILAHPGRGRTRVDDPVSLLDLLPTLVDFAGGNAQSIQTTIDGHSLARVLEGGAVSAPVFVEHIDGGTAAPRVMVRDGRFKLVFSRAYPAQLYDLADDPGELSNLAGTPDYAEVEARLTALVEQTWDLDRLVADVHANQTARKLIDAALAKGRREPWDFVPRPLAQNTRYVRHGDAFPDVERRGYLNYRQK